MTQPTAKKNRVSEPMSLMDHLQELRSRILVCGATVLIGVLLSFWFSRDLINLLKPLAPDHVHFIQLTPGEVLLSSLKLSIMSALVLALPVILFQTLRFVLPGLETREKRLITVVVVLGSVLFLAGIGFAYYAVIPPALSFLLEFGQEVAESQISIARFVEFCASLLLLTGLMFELPIVLFALSATKLVSSSMLLSQWRIAIIIILLLAAVLTPSQDPFTMIVVAGALTTLYALSIFPIRLFGR